MISVNLDRKVDAIELINVVINIREQVLISGSQNLENINFELEV